MYLFRLYRFHCVKYDSLATIDDGSCYYGGCQTPAPINLYVDNITDDRATVNWDNMNSNTCKVLKYVIRYRELGTNTWISKSGGAEMVLVFLV